MADENSGVGAVYQAPEELFENVIGAYFNLDCEALRSKTTYLSELAAYEYRPRGFYEAEYPDIAYPEVVNYRENEDGTVTLYINAVYPNGNMSKEFSHRTVIRPISEDSFQYVSNEIILPEGDHDIWWHSHRLTEVERAKLYPNESPNPAEAPIGEKTESVSMKSLPHKILRHQAGAYFSGQIQQNFYYTK